jgi:hypothetical protein
MVIVVQFDCVSVSLSPRKKALRNEQQMTERENERRSE